MPASGDLNLNFLLDVTSSTIGDGFSVNLIFGNSTDAGFVIPLPAAAWMAAPLLVGVGVGKRLRSRRAA